MKPIKYNEPQVLKRGVYPSRVASVDEDDGQYGPQLKIIFELTEGRARGQQVFGWCSQTLTPKSKLTQWATALMPGVTIGRGYALNPDDLVGCEAQLVLGIKVGTDGVERNAIESLLPIGGEAEEEAEEEEIPFQPEPAAVPSRPAARPPARQPAAASSVRF